MARTGPTASFTVIKNLGSPHVVTSLTATIYASSALAYVLEWSIDGSVGSWSSAGISAPTVATAGSWRTLTYSTVPSTAMQYWRLSVSSTLAGSPSTCRIGDFRAYSGASEYVEDATTQPTGGKTVQLEVGLSKDGTTFAGSTKLVTVLGTPASYTIGGVSDLFGGSWLFSEVNASPFSILVRRPTPGTEDTALSRVVDTLALDIYYTHSGGSIMALERQTSTQKTLLGKEATPGTNVAATIRAMSVSCDASPKGEYKEWSSQGSKLIDLEMLVREWSEAQFTGIPTYTEMGYFLAGMAKPVVSTPAAGAYLHEFRFNAKQANAFQTYTVEFGDPEDATRAHKFNFGFMSEFDIDFDRTKADFKAVMMGQPISDGITMSPGVNAVQTIATTGTGGTFKLKFQGAQTTALAFGITLAAMQAALDALSTLGAGQTVVAGASFPYTVTLGGTLAGQNVPLIEVDNSLLTGGVVTVTNTTPGGYTESNLQPILPGQIGIYVADTYAGLAAGKLTRAFVSKLSYKGLRNPVWVLNDSNASFAATIEPEAVIEVTILVEADSNGMALLTNARSGSQKFLRLLGTGGVIGATALNYLFQADLACKISALPPFSDKDGVYAAEFKFKCNFDSTNAFASFIRLQNAIAAY